VAALSWWRDEFLAYFSAGRISNGLTELINLLIEKILRIGHDEADYHAA
jgi:hypothetical protein